MSLAGVAAEEVVKWAVLGFLGLVATWVTIKHRQIMDWHRKRDARREQLDALLGTWPTVVRQIGESTEQSVRVTSEFAALHSRMDAQDQALGDLLAMNYGQFELGDRATFVCDNAGRNLMVNSAYARLLHTGRDELMDYGYRRFIKPSELGGFLARFKSAAEEHREFECHVCLVRSDGVEIKVHVRLVPHPRQTGPATHWIGSITPIDGECQ